MVDSADAGRVQPSAVQVSLAVLRSCHHFQQLSDIELDFVRQLCSEASYDPGETIAHAGMRRRHAYVILEGRVGVVLTLGREQLPFDEFRPGDIVAVGALFKTIPISGFKFVALSPVKALRLPAQRFLELCEEYPMIGYRVMTIIAHRLLVGYYRLDQLLSSDRDTAWAPKSVRSSEASRLAAAE